MPPKGMNNPDLAGDGLGEELRSKIITAIESGDADAVAGVYGELARSIENNILKEARAVASAEANDHAVMTARGKQQLTSEERSFYTEAIEKRSLANLDTLMPVTIFERVFEDLEQNHPLLSLIDFVNTTGVTEWITRKEECVGAFWGKLTDAITKELENGFDKKQTTLAKLTAFIPVSNSMLNLGPEWIDRFVRAMLSESIAIALEKGIVDGDGDNQPIGMLRDLAGSVTLNKYPYKAAEPLADLKPMTLGAQVMAPLTKNGTRSVPKVLLVVNPLDYWTKIFPATTVLTSAGTYVYGVLPIPADITQSTAVPAGKMIAGLARDYFMGINGAAAIETSDQYRFLEDEKIFATKHHGTGAPKDNSSFLVFDISTLETTPVQSLADPIAIEEVVQEAKAVK